MDSRIFSAIAAVLVIMFAAQVSASYDGVEIVPQIENIFMQKNDNVGILYTFINNSNEEKCIDISTYTIQPYFGAPYIETEFPDEDFCLGEGQSKSQALTIKTIDAPKANYSVFILLTVNGYPHDIAIANITVGETPTIDIIPYDTDICRGKEEFVNVLVRNKSPMFLKVKLNAENEILLPSFEDNEFYLDAYQEKNLKLFVQTNRLTSLGTKQVSVYAETIDGYVKKTVEVFVKDCEGITSPNFEVSLPSGCIQVQKTKQSSIDFTVRNLNNAEQTLNIAVVSDLPNYLSQNTVGLDAFESRTLHFDINARINDSTGDHNVSLIVWNENQRIEKNKCVIVKATDILETGLVENNLEIRQCESGVFTFIVKNRGDVNQNIDVNVSNIPEHITVRISDSNFTVNKKQQKEFYVFVSVAEEAELKNYDLNIVIKGKNKTFQHRAKFKVLAKSFEEEKTGLVLESYPFQIQSLELEEKKVSVKLRNNSEETLSGIDIKIKGLPEEITSGTIRGLELYPTQSKTSEIVLTIGKIPAGTYSAMLEISGPETISKEIEIVIGTSHEEFQYNGFLAGLAFLGGNIGLGLIILIIILLLALAITGIASPRQEKIVLRKGVWTDE